MIYETILITIMYVHYPSEQLILLCFEQDKKLTTAKQLSCEGRSAGGLLIGASINQAPELFAVAILGVPFVDVVCTMTDSSIPLTCGEW